jgi:glycosyltransferase involved in cell wall biosynthesis
LFAHRLAQADATGVGRYVRELTAALARAAGPGDAVVLASTPESKAPTWVAPGVETRIVGWPRRPVHAAWVAGAGPRVERSLGRVDVVHLLYPFPPIRSRAPQLVTVHDLMPLEQSSWYPRSERWIFRRTISLTLRRATRIVVPSAYVKDRVISLLAVDPARIDVVPHGIGAAYVSGSAPDGLCARFGVLPGRFAVCVGAVSTRKNLVPLIRALGRLGDFGLPLLLIGPDGHGSAAAEAEIARLRDAAWVRRTGYLPDHQVAALVKSAAVLVHPALEEGFGIVPLEAMAAGTPVIAARVSSIPEVVGDAADLVDEPTDPSAWAAALSHVLDNDERRAALAAAGRARAAMFSWQRAATTMLEIYRHAASA